MRVRFRLVIDTKVIELSLDLIKLIKAVLYSLAFLKLGMFGIARVALSLIGLIITIKVRISDR